jgi:imidazolonepropionase-like amidohydrolase
MRLSIKKSLLNLIGLILWFGYGFSAPLRAEEILLKDATVLTVTKGTIKEGDVLIRDGKIAAVGRNVKASKEAKVIDLKGRYLMPGMVDTHVHLAIEGGVNEATQTVSAEVDIGDVINEKDISIKLNLARGVTTVNAMHGSANPIGGLTQTLKMRWGRSAEELRFEGARKHIKFALGENPKRVHQDRGIASRLGVADTFRQRFTAAREYMRDWEEYRRKKQAGENVVPPRKDLELENLAAVLRGEIWVQCHSYRADEIEMLMKLADEFGFKIGAFQHVLEGYKVAPEMAKRNIGASTFADNWGYKVEAYDGISYNAAAMTQWGVRASLNTDWPVLRIGLNYEAAKSLRYGGLTDDQCLALVTINPAWQLGIDHRVGSIEVGKDADLSVWEGHPLSVYSRCVMTMIDGQIYFERKADGTSSFGLPSPPPAASANANPAPTNPSQQPAAETKPSIPASAFVPLQLPTTTALSGSATFALTNARIVTVSGPVIENGTILVENGRIKAVGKEAAVPSGVRVINARGLSVYPGFINAATTLGLTEISSVQETQDLGERGAMKAQLRAADAYNTHSAWIGVARCAGITAALVSPRGSGWMGQSALMRTAGRTVEEATLVGEAAQALSLSGAPGASAPPSGGEPVFAPSENAAASQPPRSERS